MKLYKILCLSIFFLFNQIKCWESIIVPISFDKNTHQWNALLGKKSGFREWSFFGKTVHDKKAPKYAVEALSEQTNGMITIDKSDVKGKPWFRLANGDIIHFVPVNYIAAGDLYRGMLQGGIKDDYAWLPLNEIVGQESITKQVRGTPRIYRFSLRTQEILRLWDQALQQLGTKKPAKVSKDSWKGLKNAIYFYESGKPYYEFTNFAQYSVTDAQGHEWPTSENFFQAQKFVNDPEAYKQMKSLLTPREAFNFAQMYQINQNEWRKKSVGVMLDAVRRKFNHHNYLRNLLVSTGNKTLIENAGANDVFWGAGAQGEGTNLLGQVLMRVRDEIMGNVSRNDDFIWYKNYKDYRDKTNPKREVLSKLHYSEKPRKAKKTPHEGVGITRITREAILINNLEQLKNKLTKLVNLL